MDTAPAASAAVAAADRVPTEVVFKHEDMVNGEPVGPIAVRYSDWKPGLTPYDPNRQVTWVSLTAARDRARELGVPLREV